jgi:cell division protein FtsA
MFESQPISVGLEIGTSKVCAAVGQYNERGEFTLLGLGQSKSGGVRKGEIVNPVRAQDDVRAALAQAEEKADVEIRALYLGVTGRHIECVDSVGSHPIASNDRLVTDQDIADALANARGITLPVEHTIIHSMRQCVRVDGIDLASKPDGLIQGSRVEGHVHLIHGNTLRIQTAVNLVKGLQLEVLQPVFTGLATAQAVLTSEAKGIGALVIDLGAGTTEFVFQHGGTLRHSGVLAVGGDHVSNDLAIGLKIPLTVAERLKLRHGHAIVDASVAGQRVPLGENDLGLPERTVSLEHLRRIMSVRLEEIFELIAEKLSEHDLVSGALAGVFLCGGGARTPGVATLAERVFQLPATLAVSRNMAGSTATLGHPEFATAIGLAKYGSMRHKMPAAGGGFGLSRFLARWR